MKQPGQLFLRLLLLLCLAQIKPAAACLKDCSSINVKATTTEINIDTLPKNLRISNVTFANGTLFRNSPLNNSIGGLSPGVQYIINFQNGTELCCKNITTKPSAVSELKVINIGTREVTLAWQNSDAEASKYTYWILSSPKNITSPDKSATITGLEPGTLYEITVFAQIAGTEGDATTIKTYTKPSPVSDIQPANIGTEQVTLMWKNNDAAAPNYTYVIYTDGNGISPTRNQTSQNKSAEIVGLQPGTPYNFTIVPLAADNMTKGDLTVKRLYTRPNPVFDLKVINISTTEVNLRWQNNDTAASQYTYIVVTEENGFLTNKSNTYQLTTTVFGARITGLIPGTSYTFTVFPQAGDKITGGNRKNITYYAAPVSSFNCTPVTKEPKLTLKWERPAGKSIDFSINTFNDAWSNETLVLAGILDTTITNLNYSTSYNVSIITRSCGKESLPVEITCVTSITDPPAPVEKPNITSITHNSFKIQFSGFVSKNGPLMAYAIVITTAKEGNKPPNSSLSYTYSDFKEKKTNTYITDVMTATQMRAFSSRSDSSQYEMEVGNRLKSYAYSNAPLEPLGSYWASVAGFTKIEFNDGERIVEERSYVSFTPYSQAIALPQDPGKAKIKFCIECFAYIGPSWVLISILGKTPIDFNERRLGSKSIKVENFESYFKKQQADSNCGFAEEYEVCITSCYGVQLCIFTEGEKLASLWEVARHCLEERERGDQCQRLGVYKKYDFVTVKLFIIHGTVMVKNR
ncbi:Receptor-type tyrosine-protein phosphatase eta [Platysternon megacephalum]|uniref:protein-tyrosine-phosphatase n=1 Tax=Platysternon megacephalum TaxID=55544 RepID=A0A4D9ES77_9SAUR|nr:Receptor-type tyrosine-protein phosphatase eta [Platysternon megacephalum]